ncbi:hydroxyacylglutathione hydrolase [Arenibacterium halophilum]|uniref:Hydroxyacylglutathione hydrolase n=1 Tax=Arenibacterium halophilum TaxID=2583821 RepID=A0ABY2X872_9RHOB|nr:hydroxyacylglutathione hydrolase [Arenibacterium halophilum]TMV11651.1 hydroxyacylglutathione hydrolase [Arenibacterium halophilum]
MALDIVTIPCRTDNYAFLGHNPETGDTFLVDAPEAAPIVEELAKRGWSLKTILITHHHPDHVEGLPGILAAHTARVVGARADAHRLPPLDIEVAEGDMVDAAGEMAHVIDVSGHTVGHVAFHFPDSGVVFTADSLMALGCGRVFEGTMEQMWGSLSKLAALPPDTIVCSGHEYTQANAKFALTIDPDNPELKSRAEAIDLARSRNQPTVPSPLSLELATNPFLRAADPGIRRNLGMQTEPDAAVFAEIRGRKDRF